MNERIRLSAEFTADSRQLVLKYQVFNQSSTDAYLLNRLYRSSPAWEMSPDVIYVQLDTASETVLLAKKLADLPSGIRVTAPVAPYVTPLRANSSFREEVHIPIPVKEYIQYPTPGSTLSDKTHVVVFKNIRFTLGYYWRPEGTREDVTDLQGTEVIMPRTPPGKVLEFGQLDSGLTKLDIPVVIAGGADSSSRNPLK